MHLMTCDLLQPPCAVNDLLVELLRRQPGEVGMCITVIAYNVPFRNDRLQHRGPAWQIGAPANSEKDCVSVMLVKDAQDTHIGSRIRRPVSRERFRPAAADSPIPSSFTFSVAGATLMPTLG